MTAPLPTDWAYLAGLIDGEGWVGAYKDGNGTVHPGARLEIYNQSQALVAWLLATFGGSVRERTAKGSASPLTRRSVYIWRAPKGKQTRLILARTAEWRRVKGPLLHDWPQP